jgi:hypothetical protein
MRKFIAIAVVVLGSVAGVSSASQGAASGEPRSSSDNHGVESSRLVRRPTPEAVVAEHVDALNKCDVDRLMAQYPKSVAILFPGGVTVEGRPDVRSLFEGVCKPPAAGGLNGIQFAAVKSWTVGKTVNVQWVATAPFLAAPYYGADAYVTHDGLLQAQVTTFNAADLQFVP